MSLLEKIKTLKQVDSGDDNTKREETEDNMAMNSFEEMRAKLKAKLQEKDKNKEAEVKKDNTVAESPVTETEAAENTEKKAMLKLNINSVKAKLLAKSTAGVKIPQVEVKPEKTDDEIKVENKVEEKTDDAAEKPGQDTPADTSVETPVQEEAKTASSEDEGTDNEKKTKKPRKPRAKKAKSTIVLDDESSLALDNVVDDTYDYDAMSQVIGEHFMTKDFENMINDFSNRIKDVRIESDMNLGVFKVAQSELVNLRDEVALEHSKAAYAFESAAAMVKKITDKNIGIGSSADERKANVAKALSNAVVDGVNIDITFCHSVAKLREQAIDHLLERIDAKLKACITMSAVLKMEQAAC